MKVLKKESRNSPTPRRRSYGVPRRIRGRRTWAHVIRPNADAGPDCGFLRDPARSDKECEPLIALLQKIHAGGVTIIWIEHVLHALIRLARRLVVLDAGRLVADGPVREVMASDTRRDIYLWADHDMEPA